VSDTEARDQLAQIIAEHRKDVNRNADTGTFPQDSAEKW
jgi:hypothetical protein